MQSEFDELVSMNDHVVNKLGQFKPLLQNIPADKMYLFSKEYKIIISTLQKMETLFSQQQDIYSKKDYSKQLQKNVVDDDDTQFLQNQSQWQQQQFKASQYQAGFQNQGVKQFQNNQTKPIQQQNNYQDDLFKSSQQGNQQSNISSWNHQNSNIQQQNNVQIQDLNNQQANTGASQIILKVDNQQQQIQQQQGSSQQVVLNSFQEYQLWMQQFQQNQNNFAQDQQSQQQNSGIQQGLVQQTLQTTSQKLQILQQIPNNDLQQQFQQQIPIYDPQNQIQQQQLTFQQQQQQQIQQQQQQIKIQQPQQQVQQQITQAINQPQQKIKIIQKFDIPNQQDDQQNVNQGHPLINQQQQQQKQMIQQQLEQKKQQKLLDLKNELKNQNVITVKSKKQQKLNLDDLGDFVYISYKDYVNTNQNIDVCSICLCEYFQPNDHNGFIIKLPCQHLYHKECLEGCVQDTHFKCPNCKQVYGEHVGGMPDGSMKISKSHKRCSGYPNCGSIVIFYTFPNGVHKGVHFDGTQREAYLPDNQEGQQILELLKLAFYKRITFMIGRSLTTGRDNQVVWNLHHKTSLDGGVKSFGYPDPSYFNRIRDELKEFGIE